MERVTVPQNQWQPVPRQLPLDVVIFEGWCVGFQPLSNEHSEDQWSKAKIYSANAGLEGSSAIPTTPLAKHSLDCLRTTNCNLQRCCDIFMGSTGFEHLIHLDTEDLANVYLLRLDQEHALRMKTGKDITNIFVMQTVQGYVPSYELYLRRLQQEPFVEPDQEGMKRHMRVVLYGERIVERLEEL